MNSSLQVESNPEHPIFEPINEIANNQSTNKIINQIAKNDRDMLQDSKVSSTDEPVDCRNKEDQNRPLLLTKDSIEFVDNGPAGGAGDPRLNTSQIENKKTHEFSSFNPVEIAGSLLRNSHHIIPPVRQKSQTGMLQNGRAGQKAGPAGPSNVNQNVLNGAAGAYIKDYGETDSNLMIPISIYGASNFMKAFQANQ